MKEFVIYSATNNLNGNKYIGATSAGLKIRKRKHFTDANAKRPGCKVFNAAIRKYGKDAFEWKILTSCESFSKMMDEEVRLIKELKPEYNCTSGGQGMIGLVRTPEWLEKTSRALKGRKPSPQCIEASKDKSHAYRSIVSLTDGKFFESIISAAAYYNISRKGISEVLAGRQTYCGGLSFSYSKEVISLEGCKEILDSLLEKRKDAFSRRKRRSVICLNDGKQYKSLKEAAEVYGISNSRVMQLCQSGATTQSGLMFGYAS